MRLVKSTNLFAYIRINFYASRYANTYKSTTYVIVELTGVEPVSKRGSNMLSTRLFPLNFSCASKTETTNLRLICKNFKTFPQQKISISDFTYTSLPNLLRANILRDVSLRHPCRNYAFDLLCFNQAARAYSYSPVIIRRLRFKCVFDNALRAYIPLLPAVKTKQPLYAYICLIISY